jgi:hypothetical protein
VIAALTNAVVSGVWKLAAILLLLVLVLGGLFMGAGWYLAARDRDAVKGELAAELNLSADTATRSPSRIAPSPRWPSRRQQPRHAGRRPSS